MKDLNTKERFVELRAAGWSYARIAKELHVSKPTLIAWGKAMAKDISEMRRIQLEVLKEKYGMSQQAKIETLGETLRALRKNFKRHLDYIYNLNTTELIDLEFKVLDRADKVSLPLFIENDQPDETEHADNEKKPDLPAVDFAGSPENLEKKVGTLPKLYRNLTNFFR